MASRFAARPTIGRRIAGRRQPRTATDYVKAYYEQQNENETDDGQEEGEESVFPMWKSVAMAVIMIACFASIYPKLLHPFLMYVMGFGDQSNKMQAESEAFSHPTMRHPGGAMHMHQHQQGPFAGGNPMAGLSDRFPSVSGKMAGGRMPGMMGQFASDDNTGGRGTTWHWLLPFYTIGVVVFLIYTLGKILWRRPQITARHRYNVSYNSTKDRFEAKCPGMESEEEAEEDEENDPSTFFDEEAEGREIPEEQEHAPNAFSNKQLQNLQSRLHQTESAMKHILAQLEHLSSNADPAEVESVKKTAAATLNQLTKQKRASGEEEPDEPAVISPRRNPSTEKQRKSAEHKLPPFMDTGEPRVIGDLEWALGDFQRLSDDYVKQHSKKGNKEKTEQTVPVVHLQPEPDRTQPEDAPEAVAGEAVGFDAMESEGDLVVSPPVGTLISVDGHAPNDVRVQDEEPAEEELEKGEIDQTENKHNRVRQRKGRKNRIASD